MARFPTYDEMTKRVAERAAERALDEFLYQGKSIREWIRIIASEDAVSRQAVLDLVNSDWKYEGLETDVASLPPVSPRPKTGYISIDDVMSVFNDFMYGDADENDTETFLEMLKDKVESEDV